MHQAATAAVELTLWISDHAASAADFDNNAPDQYGMHAELDRGVR